MLFSLNRTKTQPRCLIGTINRITLRKAEARGHANHGWLEAWHAFSFADCHDPRHLGFRSLRVINDDTVAPGMGFGEPPHRDMEIITCILSGALEHKDSMGNGRPSGPANSNTWPPARAFGTANAIRRPKSRGISCNSGSCPTAKARSRVTPGERWPRR
jgi:hypothetical protein